MNKLGDRGTTQDGDTEQTRESMLATESNVVPMPSHSGGVDGTRSPLAITDERKRKIEAESKRKMDYMQVEYWRMRNGKQDFMRCPYCVASRHGRRRNVEDQAMCCSLFAKAFGAILERQNQVDVAAAHVRNCHKVRLVH